MSGRPRRRLLGFLATCAAAAAGCSRSPAPDAVATPLPPPAAVAPPAAPRGAGAAPVIEAAHTSAPLRARIVSVRQETPDSIRVELALTSVAGPEAAAGASATSSIEAAVKALEGASLLAAGGRRRMFPLRGSDGARVGPRPDPPPAGGERTFWALFAGRGGPVDVILPGFAPLTGVPVTPASDPAAPGATGRAAAPAAEP
jgi:hypothetical protein